MAVRKELDDITHGQIDTYYTVKYFMLPTESLLLGGRTRRWAAKETDILVAQRE